MLSQKVKDLLVYQVNQEFYSAYLYLDFHDFYKDAGLDGYANWYLIQAQEERDHAMLFMQYLQQQGERVKLDAIAMPDKELKEFIDPLKAGAEHERVVTGLINNIYACTVVFHFSGRMHRHIDTPHSNYRISTLYSFYCV